MQLSPPRIQSVNLARALLQQAVGETTRRGADVHADFVANVDSEVAQSALEFKPSARHVFVTGGLDPQPAGGWNARAGLVDSLRVNENDSAQEECCCFFTICSNSPLDEEIIDSFRLHGVSFRNCAMRLYRPSASSPYLARSSE